MLVDDEAGRAVAEAFYRHWLGGEEPAAALRAALLETKEVDPRWAHPFYWAFYQVIAADDRDGFQFKFGANVAIMAGKSRRMRRR